MKSFFKEASVHTGYTVRLLFHAIGCTFRKPRLKMTLTIMYDYGLRSLPVVAMARLKTVKALRER